MLGNLRHLSENDLLNMVLCILAKPGLLTAFDATELEQIEAEFLRREPIPQPNDIGQFAISLAKVKRTTAQG